MNEPFLSLSASGITVNVFSLSFPSLTLKSIKPNNSLQQFLNNNKLKIQKVNYLEFYDDNKTHLEHLIHAIKNVKKRLWIEAYVLDNSYNTNKILAELSNAAKRGVEVIISYDAYGSGVVPNLYLYKLRNESAKVSIYNPYFFGSTNPILVRNHRKTVIADDTCFISSSNFDSRCLGFHSEDQPRNYRCPTVSHAFRTIKRTLFPVMYRRMTNASVNHTVMIKDSHFTAQVADSMRKNFVVSGIQDICSKTFCSESLPIIKTKNSFKNVKVVYLSNGGLNKTQDYSNVVSFLTLIAKNKIKIATSYFCPPVQVLKNIQCLFSKSSDIKLYLSNYSDVPFDEHATTYQLQKIDPSRMIKTFYTKDRHLHCKTITVDDKIAVTGSLNLDKISFTRNIESGVLILDKHVVKYINEKLNNMPVTKLRLDQSKTDLTSLISYKCTQFIGSRFVTKLSNVLFHK